MPGKRASEAERREQILQAAFEVAAREGISHLTLRGVAAEAGLSHALILFHFQRKERLVQAFLDWLIESNPGPDAGEDATAGQPPPLDRLRARLQREVERLTGRPRHTRLFFAFWALAPRHEWVRARIAAELERSRAAFRAILAELSPAGPGMDGAATSEARAAMVVSWVYGYAAQGMIEPARLGPDEYRAAVDALVGPLA